MPPGPGTEELDINSSETILLCDELGVEWMADPDQVERQVGPLLRTDRGQLDLYVTDTVLMQKKRLNLKSIARKLKQQRWYGPRNGGKSRKPYTTDIPISHAREYVNGMMRLVLMAEKSPKPTYLEFCDRDARDNRSRRPPGPGPGSASTATLPNMHIPPQPPAHHPQPLSYPHPPPSPSHHALHVHPSLPHVIRVLPLVRPTTPVAAALAAYDGDGGDAEFNVGNHAQVTAGG
jgi:hypothetical protein